ncbi:MAG: hypothetical protein ISQ27_06405 [PS1 clade bacterium]|nr:hypothetical protein [PS1 clade bacterium]CAI8370408.1 MAG: Uncharacterised protein [Rhodobiaceae bacterium UBA7378]HCQ82489.1 hypothetical protein [Rhodobiaceae bacterium]|tara:strand:+ start:901 stop:1215 length:315 start_codon:yes stop_codon:yes gene_type:complete
MIRIANMFCFLVIVALVAGVYHIRYSAEAEVKKLHALERKITAAEDMRQTLAAEWSSLNDPRRLQLLVSHHLELSPLQVHQVWVGDADTLAPTPVTLIQEGGVQ